MAGEVLKDDPQKGVLGSFAAERLLEELLDKECAQDLESMSLEERVAWHPDVLEERRAEAKQLLDALLDPVFRHPDFSDVEEFISTTPVVASVQARVIKLSEAYSLEVSKTFSRQKALQDTHFDVLVDRMLGYELRVVPTNEGDNYSILMSYGENYAIEGGSFKHIVAVQENLDSLRNLCAHFDVPQQTFPVDSLPFEDLE